MDERLLDGAVNCMTVQCPGGAAQIEQISADLLSGDPSIATVVLDDKLVIAVDAVLADQHLAIARRLRTMFGP